MPSADHAGRSPFHTLAISARNVLPSACHLLLMFVLDGTAGTASIHERGPLIMRGRDDFPMCQTTSGAEGSLRAWAHVAGIGMQRDVAVVTRPNPKLAIPHAGRSLVRNARRR